MHAAVTDHRVTRIELLHAGAAATLIVAAWFGLASANGAVGIARNDDWSYLQNAFQLAETGELTVSGWVQMTLIGQVVIAAPVVAIFGPSITALQVLVGALAVVALVSAYAVVRNFLGRTWSIVATLVLAVGPIFGLLSVSFMTDIPAASFQLLALALAYRALRGTTIAWPWLTASAAAGFIALSIREYAIVVLATIWLVTWRRARANAQQRPFVLLTVIVLALAAALFLWRSGQVTVPENQLGVNPYGLRYLAWWPLTAGLLLLPVLATVNPIRATQSAWRTSRTLTVLAIAGVVLALAHTRLGFLGNYFSVAGGYTEVIRGNPEPVLPGWWLWPLVIAAAYGSLVLALLVVPVLVHTLKARAVIIHGPSTNTSLASTFVTFTVLIYVTVPAVAETALFDRYFIAVTPIAAGLLLLWIRREDLTWTRPLAPAAGVLALTATTSVVLVAATSALDSARWQLGSQVAQQLGVSEGNIDAGFDFFNFHTEGQPRPDGIRWTWWTAQLADRAVCATVTFADFAPSTEAAGPEPGTPPIAELDVKVPLANEQRIVVYQGPDPC